MWRNRLEKVQFLSCQSRGKDKNRNQKKRRSKMKVNLSKFTHRNGMWTTTNYWNSNTIFDLFLIIFPNPLQRSIIVLSMPN